MNKLQVLFIILTIYLVYVQSHKQKQVDQQQLKNYVSFILYNLYFLKIYEQHNFFREWHQVEPLEIDQEIEQYAKNYSDYLATNKNSKIVLSNGTYGENIMRSTPKVVEKFGAYYWYNEIKRFNFSNPKLYGGVSHFTQMVWKDSKKIGCGISQRRGNVFTVCNYSPRGNIRDELEDNVFPKKEESK
uniref:SCP domain-containing protein n=1 Tax=Parastrongyloides trichosuri TaxID=131310 RepID=A0A0N4ZV27_PARTI